MQLTVSAGTGCSAYELARSQQRLVNQTEAAQKISDPSRHFFSDNQERKKKNTAKRKQKKQELVAKHRRSTASTSANSAHSLGEGPK